MSQSFSQTIALIKSDMVYRCDYEDKELTLFRALRFVVYYSTFSGIMYRFQCFFYDHHMKFIARFLSYLNLVFYTVSINSTAKIGPGFVMLHANGVIIGPNVTIGKGCMMAHQNTIMASPFYTRERLSSKVKGPVIGDNLLLGAGAVIYGDITLGNNVQVSMNCAVDQSFPNDAVLFGVPAKNVAKHQTVEKESDVSA